MGNSTLRFLLSITLFLIVSFIVFSCAGQVPPSGGLPDTIPPEIIATYPVSQTLRFKENVLRFEFSEYVDRRSFEEAVFVSPSLGKLTFDWSGREVEVQFSDSLRQHTTYVVSIGTDVKDTRNNNRMAQAFSLAFSTGDQIDSGGIAGTVFDEKNVGVMIFAYLHEGRTIDTLTPSTSKPDYLTQTGKDGAFLLPYLRLGAYRLFAIRDEYRNLLYDQQTDQFGVPNSDVILTHQMPFVSGIQFQLSREDTSPPFLSSVRSLDARHVLLKFSEPMDMASLHSRNVQIFDTASNQLLGCGDLSYTIPATDVYVVTEPQESTRVYRLELGELSDTAGNRLLVPKQPALFTCVMLEDTSRPFVTVSSTAPNLNTLEPNDTLQFIFSEPVLRETFNLGWELLDSAKQKVDGTSLWQNSMLMKFIPSSPFVYGMNYTLNILLDSVVDVSGNRISDSTLSVRLRTISESLLGSIEGKVVDESNVVDGTIILHLQPLQVRNARRYRTKVEQPGAFAFTNIPEGRYLLTAFADRDSNGVYSFGKPFQFQPSEYFTVYPDTLKVRARWPLEGVVVRFR